MTITAKFASPCSACGQTIQPGQQIEWERGSKIVRHTDCAAGTTPATTLAITLDTVGARVYLRGDTFAVKSAIKAAGGHWDADARAWWVGAAKRDDIERVIATAKPEAAEPYRPSKCRQCGARPDRRGWPRLYRSGICSDCYRDEREEAEMGY